MGEANRTMQQNKKKKKTREREGSPGGGDLTSLTGAARSEISAETARVTHPLIAMARCGFISLCVGVWITAVIMSINMDVSLGEQALDCCLKVSPHHIPKRIVSCYREQRKGDGCSINAVVFRTRKGRDLCSPYEAKWVKDLMKTVDARPVKKYKDDLCQDMKA